MTGNEWILATMVAVFAVLALWFGTKFFRTLRERRLTAALKDFQRSREYLEGRFYELAAGSGRPRGLKWNRCDFEDDVAYARERQTGNLTALVGVTIGFEVVKGGDMEGVEAVDNLRAATALFHRRSGCWSTNGRVIFNLNPVETINHYQDSLEIVAQSVESHS